MSSAAASHGAAASKPPLLEFGNYAPLSRSFRNRESLTPDFRWSAPGHFSAHQKSQTLSGKSRKLSTPSIELLQPKIQTLSGQFRRRRLRNLESTTTPVPIGGTISFDILPAAHPPSLWFCQTLMWRVFLSCLGGAA
jgi:hypothetical protein